MRSEDLLMYVLLIIAAVICVLLIFDLSPWLFILAYWVVSVIRNGFIIKRNKHDIKNRKDEDV